MEPSMAIFPYAVYILALTSISLVAVETASDFNI
jgi:hypothetical protein